MSTLAKLEFDFRGYPKSILGVLLLQAEPPATARMVRIQPICLELIQWFLSCVFGSLVFSHSPWF